METIGSKGALKGWSMATIEFIEAREILDGLVVGTLKRVDGDPAPQTASTNKIAAGPGSTSGDGGFGIMMYAVLLV
ncbi:MAG: hypothetical protein M1823_008918, partial [Watsoniomyces obsoletus]